ncbi:hypothetical protein FJZ18_03345 [Candidatus Pacearchaeota archaeon]|nr:hypothetical protein [Candidatus Pacearchaeota archaeon]
MKGMKLFLLVTVVALLIPSLWDAFPIIKTTGHAILDPTAGALLNWNRDIGMVIIVIMLTLLTSIVQKLTIDKEAMKQLKSEQKALNEEMKIHKDNPQKMMELQKKSFEFLPRTFELTLKPSLFTIAPLILLFRWFSDYFTTNPGVIFGFFSWFWAYLILTIIIASFLRKWMDLL